MLEKVDLTLSMSKKDSIKKLDEWQLKMIGLQQRTRQAGIPILILYEGWDASGKGGSILRITQKLDPRAVRVWPIGVPTAIELAHPYMWRFWSKVPQKGEIGILDRSWYGRVLVERVEKLAKPAEWKRAYREINDFETYLTNNGVVLIKFWLHISKEEQLRRFKEREADPYKKWKITADDWRNREKWDEYYTAAEDMFRRTSTRNCPWNLIPAESKHYARVETIKIVAQKMRAALKKYESEG